MPRITLFAVMVAGVFDTGCPFFNPPTPRGLNCHNFAVTIPAGHCVAIANPCDGQQWVFEGFTTHWDAIEFERPPRGVYVRSTEEVGAQVEAMCAADNAPRVVDWDTQYAYARDDAEKDWAQGGGHVQITVVDPPSAALTAEFTFVRGARDPATNMVHFTFDALASTGNIRQYDWRLVGNDGVVHDLSSQFSVIEIDLPETALRGTMRLTVLGVGGGSAEIVHDYR